jgi:hypothetical protein
LPLNPEHITAETLPGEASFAAKGSTTPHPQQYDPLGENQGKANIMEQKKFWQILNSRPIKY